VIPRVSAAGAIVAALLLAMVAGVSARVPTLSDWHDSQRVLQCALWLMAGTAAALLPSLRQPLRAQAARWGPGVTFGVCAALAAGTLSAITSGFARAGLLEVASVALSMGVLVPAVMVAREADPTRFDRAVLGLLAVCGALLVVPFLAAWVAAVSDAAGYQPDLLWRHGFSNPRFLGQFHTLLLPLLGVACLAFADRRRWWLAVHAVLAGSWLLALFTATRATWYALALSSVLLLLATPRLAGRLLAPQLLALAIALPCAWLMFEWWPGALAGTPEATLDALAGRLAEPFDLRLRDVLWARALSLALSEPLLGVGPMGLALDPNPVAAHPHSVLLQFASEWGLVATAGAILAAGAASLGLLRGQARGRLDPTLARGQVPDALLGAALLTSLGAALIHAQVDGLLVMPISQMMFALTAGWAGSVLLPPARSPRPARPVRARAVEVALPIACVAAIAVGAGPEAIGAQSRLERRASACPELARSTRFWVEGSLWDEAGPPRRFTPLAPPPGCRPGHSTGATPR